MTCIVGLVHGAVVYLGGDSLGANDWMKTQRSDPKVFRRGSMAIGYTDSFRLGQILRFGSDLPEPENDVDLFAWMVDVFVPDIRGRLEKGGYKKVENQREEGGLFLVGLRGRLFSVQGDFHVGETLCGFDAVGSGGSIAMGALHATEGKNPIERVTVALQAAERFARGVQGPFRIVSVNGSVSARLQIVHRDNAA